MFCKNAALYKVLGYDDRVIICCDATRSHAWLCQSYPSIAFHTNTPPPPQTKKEKYRSVNSGEVQKHAMLNPAKPRWLGKQALSETDNVMAVASCSIMLGNHAFMTHL